MAADDRFEWVPEPADKPFFSDLPELARADFGLGSPVISDDRRQFSTYLERGDSRLVGVCASEEYLAWRESDGAGRAEEEDRQKFLDDFPALGAEKRDPADVRVGGLAGIRFWVTFDAGRQMLAEHHEHIKLGAVIHRYAHDALYRLGYNNYAWYRSDRGNVFREGSNAVENARAMRPGSVVTVELVYPPDAEGGLGTLSVTCEGVDDEPFVISRELPPKCLPFVSAASNGVVVEVSEVEVLPREGHIPTKSARFRR